MNRRATQNYNDPPPRLHLPGRAIHLVKGERGKTDYYSYCNFEFHIKIPHTSMAFVWMSHLMLSVHLSPQLLYYIPFSDSFFCLARPVPTPQYAPTSEFLELIVSPSMAFDHFPDRYLAAVTSLWESWKWRNLNRTLDHTTQHNNTPHNTTSLPALHCTALHCAADNCTAPHSTRLHSTAQHSKWSTQRECPLIPYTFDQDWLASLFFPCLLSIVTLARSVLYCSYYILLLSRTLSGLVRFFKPRLTVRTFCTFLTASYLLGRFNLAHRTL